jgi:hypothetical protein
MPKSEDEQIFARGRLLHFSHKLMSSGAWFGVADDLIEAMRSLEPQVTKHWEALRAQLDNPDIEVPEASLTNIHMMLAGFAIENLCKGFFVQNLNDVERDTVKSGKLPSSLKGQHPIVDFVRRTSIRLTSAEEELLGRVEEAIWRGRYPIPTSVARSRPFMQMGSDVHRINDFIARLRGHVSG